MNQFTNNQAAYYVPQNQNFNHSIQQQRLPMAAMPPTVTANRTQYQPQYSMPLASLPPGQYVYPHHMMAGTGVVPDLRGHHQSVARPVPIQQNITDEQRKKDFSKSRELQQQRQKLQQFSQTGGTRPSLSADAMIHHIVGPTQAISTTKHVSAVLPQSSAILTSPATPVTQTVFEHGQSSNNSYCAPTQSLSIEQRVPVTIGVENLMAQCADLSMSSSKPKGFQKPSLKEVAPPTQHAAAGFAADSRSSQWNYNMAASLEGVFVLPHTTPAVLHHTNPPAVSCPQNVLRPIPPAFPHWASWPESKLPPVYSTALAACIAVESSLPDTARVYELLLSTGLSREVLGHVWAQANRTMPGQLTVPEFFVVLGLVGLAQATNVLPTVEALMHSPGVPTPLFPMLTPTPPASGIQLAPMSSNYSTVRVDESIWSDNTVQGSSRESADFGDFADFSTTSGADLTKSTDNGRSSAPPASSDPYAALRSLAEPASLLNSAEGTDDGFGDFVSPANPQPKSLLNEAELKANMVLPAVDVHASHVVRAEAVRHDITLAQVAVPLPVQSHNTIAVENTFTKPVTSDSSASMEPPKAMQSEWRKDEAPMKLREASRLAMHNETSFDLDNQRHMAFKHLHLSASPQASSGVTTPDNVSVHSLHREPSLSSLDLKVSRTDQLEEASFAMQAIGGTNLYDRYAAMRVESNEKTDKHVEVWSKCLEAALRLIQYGGTLFSQASSSAVCKAVTETEAGSTYLKSVGEVYRVTCRIRLSLKTTAFQTERIVALLDEVESAWENLSAYACFSQHLPDASALDYSEAFQNNSTGVATSCGVCLLSVDAASRAPRFALDELKLEYGGRMYHAQCANLWVNCVDGLLPALTVPELL